MASPSMPRSSSTVTLAPLPCRNTEFTKKTHLFTRLFEPLDFFFPPHLFTAMGLSFFGRFLYWPVSRCALADCFYTGQSPTLKNPEKMVTPGGWGLAVGAGLPPEVGSWWGSCCQRWCVPTSPNPTGKPRRLAWPLG